MHLACLSFRALLRRNVRTSFSSLPGYNVSLTNIAGVMSDMDKNKDIFQAHFFFCMTNKAPCEESEYFRHISEIIHNKCTRVMHFPPFICKYDSLTHEEFNGLNIQREMKFTKIKIQCV